MRKTATRFFGVLLAMSLSATAVNAAQWDSTTVNIPNLQNPSAVPFAAPGDTVNGIYGIIIAKDTIQTAYGFWIQLNRAGNVPWTGIETFHGSNASPSPSGALAHGDSVQLFGRVNENASNTQFIAKDGAFGSNLIVNKISSGNQIPAFKVGTVNEFHELNAGVEQWEGMLVRVPHVMRVARKGPGIVGFTPGSNCIAVDSVACPPSTPAVPGCDSLFIDTASLSATATPDVGTFVKYVQGVVRQTTRGYRILVRGNTPDLGDLSPPAVTDAYCVTNDSIRVVFDRGVDSTSAVTPGNYSLQSLGSVTGAKWDTPASAVLKVTTSLTPGQSEKLTVNNVIAKNSGLAMTTPADRYFTWGILTIADIQSPHPDSLTTPPCRDYSKYLVDPPSGPIRLTYRGVITNILPGGAPIYFAQDLAGGVRSGVAVFAPPAALIKGNKYLMVSSVQEFGSGGPAARLTEMTGLSYIRNEGVAAIPAPILKSIAVLRDTTCDATQSIDSHEDYEGVLVQIQNAKITEDRNFGQSFFTAGPYPACTDSMLIDNTAGSSKFAQATFKPTFGYIVQVTGVMHSAFGLVRIEPRDSTDIVLSSTSGVDPVIPARVTFSVSPNPARQARVTFGLPRRANVDLAVFDVSGRRLRSLAKGVFEPGEYRNIVWDGRDASGSEVGAGLFFYRLNVDGETHRLSGVRLK